MHITGLWHKTGGHLGLELRAMQSSDRRLIRRQCRRSEDYQQCRMFVTAMAGNPFPKLTSTDPEARET